MNKNAVTARKAIKFIDSSIDRVLTVLFLIVLFIGAYFIYDSWYVFNAATLSSVPGYVWKGPETLTELPSDAKAWLVINDTEIDCPIMQGETNEDYLNKNPYGEYSLSGSVFLDCNNSPDFTDDYSLLYGHNMNEEHMFGALNDYVYEDFFDNHRRGILTVKTDKPYEITYDVNIFAILECKATDTIVFDVRDEGDLRAYINNNAKILRTHNDNERILALSTCTKPLGMGRLVVFATIKERPNATSMGGTSYKYIL